MARLKRMLREPLLHFLVIGAALFAGYQMFNPAVDTDPQSTRIELTRDDLLQLSVAQVAKGLPPPTVEQLKSLVEHRVREEILYREALALGLDKDDTIIKRRLAQKMDFLAEDISAIEEPSSQELRDWFADNQERFATSPRVSFRHLYFSFDRGRARAQSAAAEALQALAGKPREWQGAGELADPFMFQEYYGDRTFDEMAKLFGTGFARELLQLGPGAWRGPFESGYGWHLIFLDAVTPSRVPEFEAIERDVKSAWLSEQRALAKRKAYEAMRARYEVVLPELPGEQTGRSAATAAEPSGAQAD